MENRYEQLGGADTVEEILAVTREYLATWHRHELECLPAHCRPTRVDSPHDIEQWADLLAAEAGDRRAAMIDEERRLDRMASHFLIAAVRIRRLPLARLAA